MRVLGIGPAQNAAVFVHFAILMVKRKAQHSPINETALIELYFLLRDLLLRSFWLRRSDILDSLRCMNIRSLSSKMLSGLFSRTVFPTETDSGAVDFAGLGAACGLSGGGSAFLIERLILPF